MHFLPELFPPGFFFRFPHRLCSVKRPEKAEEERKEEETTPPQMELFRVSYFFLVIVFSVDGNGLEDIK